MSEGALDTQPTPRAGDPLPPAVGNLLTALAAADTDVAADCFATDAVWAPPGDESNEVAPRAIHQGRDAIRAALEADPHLGRPHAVRLCLHEGSDCMLEGELTDSGGEAVGHHAASIQLDADGLVSRAMVFRIPAVEDNAGVQPDHPSGVDIQTKIDDYFVELDSAHFENAASYFSPDGLYLHPPYTPDGPRVAFRGTDELLAGFERRGAQDWAHFTDASIQRGPFLMFEGHALIDGTPEGPTGSFVASATADEEGKVLRYLAFYTAPMVPRR